MITRLGEVLGDRLIRPTDEGFAESVAIWNPAVRHRPGAVVRCGDREDVRTAVLAARDTGVPLAVRSGGHDWAGRCLREAGLVLDLTGMRQVSVDPAARTATVGGGALAGDLLDAAASHRLATATGVVRAVGLAGLTMAGGYGPLGGRCGLALDNLLGADVVLADGTVRRASADGDTELFWAIRGGGGNFGVLTSLTFQLHELPVVFAGMIMFPLAQAGRVFAGYRELVADCPDELTVMAGFLPGPDGHLAFVCPMWSGADLAEGERQIERLAGFGDPVVRQIAPMPYHEALRMFDASLIPGNSYALRTRWLREVTGDVADALADAAARVSSPFSAIALHHFHGAATRVGVAETAFGLRERHHLAEVIAVWAPGDSPQAHESWADALSAALEPLSLPGGYPNLLGPDETDRVRLAFGPNFDRLMRAKRHYDPDNVFASAVPTLPT